MRFTRLLCKICLLAILVTSCSKNDSVAPGIQCYLTSLTDTIDIDLTLTYNSSNQVTGVQSSGGGLPSTFNYDSKGNITSIVNGLSTMVLTYNANGLLISISNGSGSGSSTTTLQYNGSGQVTSETNEFSGFTETYTFAYPNTTTRNYVSRTLGTTTTTYEYDTKNTPTHAIKGIQLSLTDDTPSTDNNVTKRTTVSGSSTNIYTYSYVYNEHGYPTTQTTTFPGSMTPQVVTFTYACK